MTIVEILWHIKRGEENEFRKAWREKFTVGDRSELIGEFLSAPRTEVPDIYRSLNLDQNSAGDDVSYFVNVAIWTSFEAFKKEIEKYIPKPGTPQPPFVVNRYRVVLDPIDWRIGQAKLPSADSEGTL